MIKLNGTKDFLLGDISRSLFPMTIDEVMANHAGRELDEFIYQRVLDSKKKGDHFLPQLRVYAAKPQNHLRRTVKLDPVASWFMHDIVYRNRNRFRKPLQPNRLNFGYCFSGGAPTPGAVAYSLYRGELARSRENYKYELVFDIASYFNSIYHHDLINWFRNIAESQEDSEHLGLFLRETNAGRSLDCLPQGIYPCKMIGNAYLSFLDYAQRIKCAHIVRFMDDVHLFDANETVLLSDFERIQRLLGEKGLNVNPQKTLLPGEYRKPDTRKEVGTIKANLLQLRRARKVLYDDDDDDSEPEVEERNLTAEERSYLLELLDRNPLEEEDAELVLSLIKTNSDEVVEHLRDILAGFPNLAKTIHSFCKGISDKEALAEILHDVLLTIPHLGEFQLFWFAALVEDFLLNTSLAGSLLSRLYEHENASALSRAKVLEIPEGRYGMPDLREEHLKTGSSDWQAWCAAIGARNQPKAQRGHFLKYFSNGSSLNHLVYQAVQKIPDNSNPGRKVI